MFIIKNKKVMPEKEFFDVLDENGKKLMKVKERSLIHKDGDWHGSVHIWLMREVDNKKIEFLLQRRAEDKDSYPGCLDVSSAGHVDAGEDFIDAAQREVQEELGIKINKEDLYYLFTQKQTTEAVFHNEKFISNEINKVYLVNPKVNIDNICFQKDEISEIRWIESEALMELLNKSDEEICIKKQEYHKVYKFILNELT